MTNEKSTAVVFVPGLGGFNKIGIFGGSIEYFRGLKQGLQRPNIDIFFPPHLAIATVVQRAEYLAWNLAGIRAEQIYLLAHSMGGIDCRYFIHYLDKEHRVRGLATVATPHRGTPLANWFLETRGPLQWLAKSIMKGALEDLTIEACDRFNQSVPDRSDVNYWSYAGVRSIEEMPTILRPSTRLLFETTGENDSQVPLSSAKWGAFMGEVCADHNELVGWNFGIRCERSHRPFDHLVFYQRVVFDLSIRV